MNERIRQLFVVILILTVHAWDKLSRKTDYISNFMQPASLYHFIDIFARLRTVVRHCSKVVLNVFFNVCMPYIKNY